jgi:hypothetical protein
MQPRRPALRPSPPYWAVFALALPSAATAQPRLFFTDLESGPVTGGDQDLGAFVTLYGEGFGATQGASIITFGGTQVARYVSWQESVGARGLDRIVVQPGPNALSGNIVVTVGGQASNALPFTMRAGNLYFVELATGADGNPGTHAQPWATLWRPRQTLAAGDTVYGRRGQLTAQRGCEVSCPLFTMWSFTAP